ncbi:helix-turn-helix domain-containing protein [Actinokineospora sp. 24-640]
MRIDAGEGLTLTEPGEILRQLRERKGYSLTRLAKEANYNKGYLSKIENGERPLSPDKAMVFDRILATDGVLTRALAPPPARPDPPPDDEDLWSLVVDPGGGTHFVPDPYAGAVGAGLLDPAAMAPNCYVVDERTVALFGAQFEGWRMMGHGMSPAHVLPGLLAQCVAIRQLVTDRPMPELVRMASRYAEYAGWMYQEIGDADRALLWTRTAVRIAASVGDTGLGSYALVRAAEIALYREDGYTMVDLARRAAGAPGATAAIRSLAAQREAQGHALLGDLTACLSALDEAERWQEQAMAESGPHYGTTSLSNPLAFVRGWAMVNLARSEQSVALLAAELDGIPSLSVRSRARFGVRLARAQADAGDIDSACAGITGLLGDLRRIDSATVRVDVRHLAVSLTRHSSDPLVRELRPELGDLLRGRR